MWGCVRDTFTELTCVISGSLYFKCPWSCSSLLVSSMKAHVFVSILNFLLILEIKEIRSKCWLRWSVCWQFAFKSHMQLEASFCAQCCHLLLETLYLCKDLFYFCQYQLEKNEGLYVNVNLNSVFVLLKKRCIFQMTWRLVSFSLMYVRAIIKNLDNFT